DLSSPIVNHQRFSRRANHSRDRKPNLPTHPIEPFPRNPLPAPRIHQKVSTPRFNKQQMPHPIRLREPSILRIPPQPQHLPPNLHLNRKILKEVRPNHAIDATGQPLDGMNHAILAPQTPNPHPSRDPDSPAHPPIASPTPNRRFAEPLQ